MALVLKATRRAAAVALSLVSLMFLSPTPAQAATYVELRNDETMKCMAIPSSDDSNGVAAVQWTCNDNDDQRWELRDKGDGEVWLVNKATGKCLAAGHDDGTTTFQYSCEGSSAAEFLWIYDSIGRLRHPYGDWCLAVPHSDTASGVKPILWKCTLSEDQQWS